MHPHEVLPRLLREDPAAPRITFYDDTPGSTQGERIELSGKVLNNWVAKAGNLLAEHFDVEPGRTVALDLPPEHWRTLYWALGVWAVGGTVSDDPDGADVVISTNPKGAQPTELAVTTLAALARSFPGEIPAGALDEARELPTYPDVLEVVEEADADDLALQTRDESWTYANLVPAATSPVRAVVSGSLAEVLRTSLALWSAGGSVVILRGTTDPAVRASRRRSEGAQDMGPITLE
ncbi:TIGR03089 family protein [Demetria terragena]|uniref:TIGR03089 family protein n=1 Tax=Demetria terragena TaxID=63959 RepID=UPI000372C10B|nr:TIGR03089 family protein [Demetria terragena]